MTAEGTPPQAERDGTPFTTIVGIDCATRARKVGLARGRLRNGSWILTDARCASTDAPPAETAARWIVEDPSCLLALDAPLGWPEAMGRALPSHEAGGRVEAPADRIARTAHATLEMLATIRELSGMPIPLAWSPAPPTTPAAIEVYPAATLAAHGVVSRGYKGSDADSARAKIHALIEGRLHLVSGLDLASVRHDGLDAVLCVVAGLDFLAGAAAPPEDPALARREGWIWIYGGGHT